MINIIRPLTLVGLTILSSSIIQAAEVYQCKKGGSTIYQSRPCPGSIGNLGGALQTQHPDTARAAAVNAQPRSSSKSMPFETCKRNALGAQFLASGRIQSKVITDNAEAYVIKLCGEDGGATLTCSAKDSRVTVTRYKTCS